MFRPNNQLNLFSAVGQVLNERKLKLLSKTLEKGFHEIVFNNIDEMDYKDLYSKKMSRPNVPVNILVASLILKHLKSWSFDELLSSVRFDLRTMMALGLNDVNSMPFGRATIYNFQNRLLEYEEKTGINLLEKTFDNLTEKQLKQLNIQTTIQRIDSTLIFTNSRQYSRVQLIIETLLRMWRKLDSEDKRSLSDKIKPYEDLGSEHYIYQLKPSNFPHELKKLGELYFAVYEQIKDTYSATKEFRIFERVYHEHFIQIDASAQAKEEKELNSSMLQSPDDEDATYRKKGKQEGKGFTINVTETASPENELQVITDIAVNKNNVDDSRILETRIDKIVKKTPDIEEMHGDGAFGSKNVDKKMEKYNVTLVTTAIKGRESKINKIITQADKNKAEYMVSCENQEVKSIPTKKKNVAIFDTEKCKTCPLKEQCDILEKKGRYYFTHLDYLRNKRNNNIHNIPKERRKLRPNIEATISEFKRKTQAGKLKVRGIFKASLFAFAMGISINFGRIFRHLQKNGNDSNAFSPFFHQFLLPFPSLIFATQNLVQIKNVA